MNEYITTAQFVRAKENVKKYEEWIKKCMAIFNERSQSSSNYKVIHSITYPNDYTFEIRWASANPINILQAGRALRLFSDLMLEDDDIRKKIISGKFLSYRTVNAGSNDALSSGVQAIELLANLVRTNPSDERIEKIREILLK